MYKKYKIKGIVKVVTGLHIGGSTQFSPIGAVDSPVIRDTLTNEPILPGSSLKGKMRTLLSRMKSGGKIIKNPNDDPQEILELFGSSKDAGNKGSIIKGRLQFMDMRINKENKKTLIEEQFLDSLTEIKFENTIDRLTGTAMPRQIERVVPGVEFDLEIMYDAIFDEEMMKENSKNEKDKTRRDEMKISDIINEDFELIGQGLKLIQLDYLGGNGSRGHGRIEFDNIVVQCVFGAEKDEKKFENGLAEKIKGQIGLESGESNAI